MIETKITLPESEIPTHFYNIVPDLPSMVPPPLHPGTRQPIGPEMLAPIFPMELIAQEVSAAPAVEIPDEVREIYRLYRPTPVLRATAINSLTLFTGTLGCATSRSGNDPSPPTGVKSFVTLNGTLLYSDWFATRAEVMMSSV